MCLCIVELEVVYWWLEEKLVLLEMSSVMDLLIGLYNCCFLSDYIEYDLVVSLCCV